MEKLQNGDNEAKKNVDTLMNSLIDRVKTQIISKTLSIVSSIVTIIGVALLIFANIATAGLICFGIGSVMTIGLIAYNKFKENHFVKQIEKLEPEQLLLR